MYFLLHPRMTIEKKRNGEIYLRYENREGVEEEISKVPEEVLPGIIMKFFSNYKSEKMIILTNIETVSDILLKTNISLSFFVLSDLKKYNRLYL